MLICVPAGRSPTSRKNESWLLVNKRRIAVFFTQRRAISEGSNGFQLSFQGYSSGLVGTGNGEEQFSMREMASLHHINYRRTWERRSVRVAEMATLDK